MFGISNNITIAFLLTLMAGLSTGIGSAVVLITKRTNEKLLSFSLGLSAGVMLYVSFVEILGKSVESLSIVYGEKMGNIMAVIGFFIGIGIIAIIDKFMPDIDKPCKVKNLGYDNNECFSNENELGENKNKNDLMRMGIFTALAISIHNFPEGLATFISAIDDPEVGVAIAFAIAIHNIPEGIAVAVPIYYATGNRVKAFKLSLLSGITEPIGALIGYFCFIRFFGDEAFGFIFSAVAGIMVYISLDELLPAAKEYGEHKISMWGLIIGMIIMAISLILFI